MEEMKVSRVKGRPLSDNPNSDPTKVAPLLHIRVSAWTRSALRQLVDDGTYKTMGHALDQIVKNSLAGEDDIPVLTIPRTTQDLKYYFPILAADLPEGIFGVLSVIDKRLCVLIAFFSELNDLAVADLANCNPERVKRFRVSDMGVASVGVGEDRYILAQRLRFWKRLIRQGEDIYHPHAKQSENLIAACRQQTHPQTSICLSFYLTSPSITKHFQI